MENGNAGATVPLDASTREIKLLHLRPGEENEVVSVRTTRVSLCDSPIYFALSYVWGDASDQYPILVDGCHSTVSCNLFYALQHLRNIRGKDSAVPFWIDALSINQSSPSERSSQVCLMKDIFGLAYTVFV